MRHFLDFEKPLAEIEGKIEELRHLSNGNDINIADEVSRLEAKVDRLLRQTYAKLTPWQKVQLARHPDRPHGAEYVKELITEFAPLAGDRGFAEDRAILGGIGRFRGHSVVVLAHEKGADTEARIKHNFGMAKPEGYRKARRLMALADRFGLPLLTFIDTPGAYPGIDAEARGQAEAIARSIEACLKLTVPMIATVIGEGGSGGRAGACRRQQGTDDGACGLFRHLARGLRLDHLAHGGERAGCRRGAEAHGAGSAEARRHRRHHRRAARRRASRAATGGRRGRRRHRGGVAPAGGAGRAEPAPAAPGEIPRHGQSWPVTAA